MSPPNPWSTESVLIPNFAHGTQYKPAVCGFEDKLVLAWAGTQDSSSFKFTTWLPSDDGWAAPTSVQLNDSSQYQSDTSALVVFNNVLYAFVPWTSPNSQGLSIFRYDGTTFQHVGDWGSTWSKAIAAVVCDNTLHVVAANPDGHNHMVWTWSNAGLTAITGPSGFSANTFINESTTSNPALIVRNGKVVLLLLANTDDRTVLESTLTVGSDCPWARSDTLSESGNSGVSAAATPDGQRAWLCVKKHNGRSNLICHYKNQGNCWSTNYSMGSSDRMAGLNEAALVFWNDWLYAIWNNYQDGAIIYYSRRPAKQLLTDSWMGDLVNQDISISALSIPGTHDSGSVFYPDGRFESSRVQCQSMTITEQLNAGIRYFDLRAGVDPPSGQMTVFHGEYNCEMTFSDIFQFMYTWLANHQTEAIIVQVKNDQEGPSSQGISNMLYNMICGDPHWVLDDTIPTLAQIRGKIQLVRRFERPNDMDNTGRTFGINALSWPQNRSGPISNSTQASIAANTQPPITVPLYIEDVHTFNSDGSSALEDKTMEIWNFVEAAAAKKTSDNTWYIGYSSYMTSGGLKRPFLDLPLIPSMISIPDTPENYATAELGGQTPLNTALEEHVLSKGRFGKPAYVGTLVMDYPQSPTGTLIESIIYTNDLVRK